ncbi:MAG: GGDEF domain-containing protein [Alphaproteobacteria bacterium]|nr:MAG: GGDEF domain-containing protein [Alphaproteobacteria bacterium]
MSDQEFRRAVGYATSAIELLKRATIPPYPHFYELLYTYATGVNPALNARINAILATGEASVEMAERLYNEFVRSQDANERLTGVSERMSHRIEAMHDAIDTAMATANAYSATLQTTNGDLAVAVPPVRLKQIATTLLAETRRMQNANMTLERTLEASRAEIATLQRDLDDVRREALLDPLTKVHNRKAFDDGLLRSIAHASESGSPLCLMLIDIDHFKRFNDTWGHQTGDQVLRLVAMTVKSNIKGKDLAARYGGEEFGAILPDTDLEDAMRVADNIRRAIQAKELLKRSTNEKLGRVTASFGVAMLRPEDSASTLIERADRCLYAAKRAGRNAVLGEASLGDETAAA